LFFYKQLQISELKHLSN